MSDTLLFLADRSGKFSFDFRVQKQKKAIPFEKTGTYT